MAGDPALRGEAFNFSSEEPLTVLEVVGALQRASGRDLEPEIRASATHEIPAQHLSATKARKLLGWSPQWSTEDALAETVDWYRDYLAGVR
jgi:CDP-glucose 4,6-dehydratase